MKECKHIKILTIIFIAAMISIACNFQGFRGNQPRETIPVTTQAANNLQEKILEALDEVASGKQNITLSIEEAELTSLVAFELQKIPEPQILEPQIYLRDGQVQVFASLKEANVSTPIQLVIEAQAGADGYPQYQVVSAMMGPVPLPGPVLDQITSLIDRVLSEKIHSQAHQVFIHSIQIADGVMTIQGESR